MASGCKSPVWLLATLPPSRWSWGGCEEPDSSRESRSKSVLIMVRSWSSCSCEALSVDNGCNDTGVVVAPVVPATAVVLSVSGRLPSSVPIQWCTGNKKNHQKSEISYQFSQSTSRACAVGFIEYGDSSVVYGVVFSQSFEFLTCWDWSFLNFTNFLENLL